jgi:hypothetical protein
LAPAPVTWVSKYQFGFVLTSRSATSAEMAVQGYAMIDPAVGADPGNALEFVAIAVGPTEGISNKQGVETKAVGVWSVSIDHDSEAKKQFERAFRALHVPVRAFVRGFEVKRVGGTPDTDARKNQRLLDWEDVMSGTLGHSDFEEFTNSEFRHAHIQGMEDIRQQVKKSIAYGWRDNGPVELGDKFVMMKNEWSPSCTQEDGGLGAAVMYVKPRAEVQSDNGSLVLMVYGVGSCARGTPETTQYIDKVLDATEADLLRSMGE